MIELILLGDPVEHSLSPTLQEAALAAAGLDGRYSVRRVDEAGMQAAADEMRNGLLQGANITMPHKRIAARLCDRLGPVAERTGSVNTWSLDGDLLFGHSTDGEGVRFAVRHAGLPPDGPVLILGSGGAAAAAVAALDDRELLISARRSEAAAGVLARLDAKGEVVPWGTPHPGALVINATPLGMQGERLPDGIVGAAAGLFDMVYGEMMTPAVAQAVERGIPVSDGIPMLVGQARASFRIWTGREVASDVMLEALNLSRGQTAPPKNQMSRSSGVEPCR